MTENKIIATLSINSRDLAYAIKEKILHSSEFTTVTSAVPEDIAKIGLLLIRFEPYLGKTSVLNFTHIGILRKGQRVATNQVRIKVTDIIDLPPLDEDTILSETPVKLKKHLFGKTREEYKKIPPETGKSLYRTIVKLCPKQRDAIEILANKTRGALFEKMQRANDAAVEKDATALCLDIFGIDRSRIIQSWNPREGINGESFLTGLKQYSIYEDDIISHDLHSFPGWKQISKSITGIVEFKNEEDERLLIINANRKPLEKAFGVDLIYYHQKYEAFTFVQYKIMENQNETKSYYYNPNQKSHREELSRMDNFNSILKKNPANNKLDDYRFGECPIFFKLCRKIELKAEESGIAQGAYISLNHWNILLKDPSILGPKGGLQIGFHTLNKRYLGTQAFVELVQRGLLGTSINASRQVSLFIKASLEMGHSVVFAFDQSVKSRGPFRD